MINYPSSQDIAQASANTGFTGQFNSEYNNIYNSMYNQAYNAQYGPMMGKLAQSMGHATGPAANSRARMMLAQQVMGPAFQAAMQQQSFRNQMLQSNAAARMAGGGGGGQGGGMPGWNDGKLGSFLTSDSDKGWKDFLNQGVEDAWRQVSMGAAQGEIDKQRKAAYEMMEAERSRWARANEAKYGYNPVSNQITDPYAYNQFRTTTGSPEEQQMARQYNQNTFNAYNNAIQNQSTGQGNALPPSGFPTFYGDSDQKFSGYGSSSNE